MIINTEIVDAYLNGENISKFSSLFIYRQADRSIFQEPEKDKAEIVSKIKDEIINHICAILFLATKESGISCLRIGKKI